MDIKTESKVVTTINFSQVEILSLVEVLETYIGLKNYSGVENNTVVNQFVSEFLEKIKSD